MTPLVAQWAAAAALAALVLGAHATGRLRRLTPARHARRGNPPRPVDAVPVRERWEL